MLIFYRKNELRLAAWSIRWRVWENTPTRKKSLFFTEKKFIGKILFFSKKKLQRNYQAKEGWGEAPPSPLKT